MVHMKQSTIDDRRSRRDDFEHKRNTYDIRQDDFFIIGPNYEKCAPAIAYRNKLKRRAKTTSPSQLLRKRTRSPADKPHTRVVVRNVADESVQTENHRRALADEIRKIREDLERRKQELRDKPEAIKPALNKKTINKPSDVIVKTKDASNSVPLAPRKEKHEHILPLRQKVNDIRTRTKVRSLSPIFPIRLTEYQRAYQPPGETYFKNKCKPFFRKHIIPDKAETTNAKTLYETEYQHEYKPFKYISENEFRSSSIEGRPATNLVVIPRPKTASVPHRPQRREKTVKTQRSLTPDAFAPLRRPCVKRFISEYGDQYRSYAAKENGSMHKETDKWHTQTGFSHFSREHLAQLDSNVVDYWDMPSTDRYALNRDRIQKELDRPAAGLPSMKDTCELDQDNSIKKNYIKFDSTNVYHVMEQDENSFDSENSYSTESDVPLARRNYGVTTDPWPYKAPPCASIDDVTSLSKYSSTAEMHESTPPRDIELRLNNIENIGHHDKELTKAFSPIGSISPLSLESMASNASIASQTLERARRARDRVCAEYHHTASRPYTPLYYTGQRREE